MSTMNMTFFRGRDCAAHCNGTQFHLTVFKEPTWDEFPYKSCSFLVTPLNISPKSERKAPGTITVNLSSSRPGTVLELASSSYTKFATLVVGNHRGGKLNIDTRALSQAMNTGQSGGDREREESWKKLANAQRVTLMGMGSELGLVECSQGEYVGIYHQNNSTSPGFG